jgi:hypothetical protein
MLYSGKKGDLPVMEGKKKIEKIEKRFHPHFKHQRFNLIVGWWSIFDISEGSTQ